MKPTKIMPYIVIVDDGKQVTTYGFRTERQSKKFSDDVQIGTNYKVAMYVSILKGKRGAK